MEPYVETVIREAQQQSPAFPGTIETVYIGGGTPSVLPERLLIKLVQGISRIFPLHGVTEFTTEANPGAVSEHWIQTAAGLGINRFSFGMQAYQNKLLHILGRIHCYDDVRKAVTAAQDTGASVNLDLMFGIPEQTAEDWHETLERALELKPDHISAYGLIQESGTEMDRRLSSGQWRLPEPEEEREMYETAIQLLKENSLFQYEISNFSKPGKECLHNIGYWKQIPYLGLGLSAASMTPISKKKSGLQYQRMKNPDTFEQYYNIINRKGAARETETIRLDEARFETMMLGLRMTEGIREDDFLFMHGITLTDAYGEQIEKNIREGFLSRIDGCLRLTRKGMDFQNTVLMDLMV